MFSSSEQLHFQTPAAVPTLHTLGDTKGWHVNRQQCMQHAACPSTHKAGSIQGKQRIWANAATQALMHLDLCMMPLLFIPLHYFPAPMAQHSAETVEQTSERAVPQWDWKQELEKVHLPGPLDFSPSRWDPHFWIQLQL